MRYLKVLHPDLFEHFYNEVLNFFEGDDNTTRYWFTTPNNLLGGLSPIEMISRGRERKLYKLIESSMYLNGDPD